MKATIPSARRKAPQPEHCSNAVSRQPRSAGLSCLCVLLLLFSGAALAWDCTAEVLRVHDGDTLTLRCPDRRFKLRLRGVDAPEYHQTKGPEARQALADKLDGQVLRVNSHAVDRYGRVIGDVWVADQELSLWMVTHGWAWCALRAPAACKTLQERAREQRLGLWQNEDPEPPWAWRKKHPR